MLSHLLAVWSCLNFKSVSRLCIPGVSNFIIVFLYSEYNFMENIFVPDGFGPPRPRIESESVEGGLNPYSGQVFLQRYC